MKKWINDVDGIDIKQAFESRDEEEKTPPELDDRILKALRMHADSPVFKKSTISRYKKFLPAGIMAAAVLTTFFIILNLVTGNPGFTISGINNHVLFKEGNNDIILKKGSPVKKGYRIISGETSQCVLAYGNQAFIEINEKTEILATTSEKTQFLFNLIDGSILVNEHIQKGVIIEIQTECARVRAIGTRYTVTHNAKNGETIIKAIEGILQVEPIPRDKQIILKTGEEVILGQNSVPDKKEIDISDTYKTIEWKIKIIIEKPLLSEPVVGFGIYAGLIIACTQHSVSCLTESGTLWVDVVKPGTIQAQPFIYNDNVYILQENEIFVYDIYTGNRKAEIKTNEQIKTGYGMFAFNNRLFLVFASGIYQFSPDTGKISSEPFIPVPGASIPVSDAKTIYFASYMANNFFACDVNGNTVWSCTLDSRSDCKPVIIDNSILAGTKEGFLYQISARGSIENQLNIKENIISIQYGNKFVFVFTAGQNLYKIDLAEFRIKDIFADINTAIMNGNILVLGTAKGMIKIIDTVTWAEKEIQLPYSKARIFTNHKNNILAGLENGGLIELVCE